MFSTLLVFMWQPSLGLSTTEEETSGILPLLLLRHACRVSRGSMPSAVLAKHFLVRGCTRLQGWIKSRRLGMLYS
jgi:hypothetical protein